MKRTLAALVAALGLLAACGSDAATTADTTTTLAAVDAPEAIVSMSASATEMLFAIGAGDQVVAVDSTSNYPPEAPITDLSAYPPNVEAISAYEPDLVITDGTGDLDASLDKIGINVLALPAATALQDTYDQIEQLGEVTGHVAEAEALVAAMQRDVDEILQGVPARDEPLTFFHELDDTLYSVSSTTFIGSLYSLVGLENIADAADADGQSGGYPQLSAEYLVSANPAMIFLADTKCCEQTAATVAARPGFSSLQAVTNGDVIELDDDVASRWGPRVVDFLREIVAAVKALTER
ncbi:MAG: ABC transporter substrate-binding protein [Acidimicrobiales bacterium]